MLSTLNVTGASGSDGSHFPIALIVPMSFNVIVDERSYPSVGFPAAPTVM